MAYLGSQAYRIDSWGEPDQSAVREQSPRTAPRFRTYEGGGLDAEARRGISPEFWLYVRGALVALGVVLALWSAIVCVRANTVTLMAQNNKLESQISEVQEENRELQVTRSVLSSTDRIERIATQNYGMVAVKPTATIVVSADD